MITSGYVSRIPVPPFSNLIKDKLSQISKEAYEKKVKRNETQEYINKIDKIIFDYLNLEEGITNEINYFTHNLLKAV